MIKTLFEGLDECCSCLFGWSQNFHITLSWSSYQVGEQLCLEPIVTRLVSQQARIHFFVVVQQLQELQAAFEFVQRVDGRELDLFGSESKREHLEPLVCQTL